MELLLLLLISLLIIAGGFDGVSTFGFDDDDFGPMSKEELIKKYPDATDEEINWYVEEEIRFWS